MSTSAKDAPGSRQIVPTEATGPNTGGRVRLMRGLSVAEVLGTAVLRGSQVLAGARGLHRPVQRLNVMERPDSLEVASRTNPC